MDQDQIKIKFVKCKFSKVKKEYLFPKDYVFKLTPAIRKQFKSDLQAGKQGLMKNKNARDNQSVFQIIELGHFDDEVHVPLQIIKMFND